MRLAVRRVDNQHTDIHLHCAGTTVDLGWHEQSDLNTLGGDLVDALISIAPSSEKECAEWIRGLLAKAGVSIPRRRWSDD